MNDEETEEREEEKVEQKEEEKEAKKFSEEYPKPEIFDAEQIELKAVLGQEITIKKFNEMTGENGEFLVILAEFEGTDVQFIIGSTIVVPKLRKAKEDNNLPIVATITEEKSEKNKRKYYDIK